MNYFWDEKSRFVILLGGKDFSNERLATDLRELAERTQADAFVSLSIGSSVSQAELLHTSYQAACDALETTDLASCGVIIQVSAQSQGIDMDLLYEKLRILFYLPPSAERTGGYRRLAGRLCQNGWTPAVSSGLMRACLHVLAVEFPVESNLQNRAYQQLRQVPQCKEECAAGVIAILEQMQMLFNTCLAQRSPMVQRAAQYIRDGVNNGTSVSIKEFCAKGGLTPAYLGHVFKKETGVFFSDYLLQCRVDRSVVLLQNPNRRIKDIAEAVGFTSTSYYVKCFRERKGILPAKYRQDQGE